MVNLNFVKERLSCKSQSYAPVEVPKNVEYIPEGNNGEDLIEEHLEKQLADIVVEEKNKQFKIVIFTYYYPIDKLPDFVTYTRKTFEYYCDRHGYAFYFDDSKPENMARYYIHHYRCFTGLKLQKMFPNAEWFIYVDADVFVNRP